MGFAEKFDKYAKPFNSDSLRDNRNKDQKLQFNLQGGINIMLLQKSIK